MTTRYITEILTEINDDPKLIEKYKGNAALRLIFEHAFLPEKKFALPDGEPPFKKDAAPMGMTPGNLYQEVRKLYIFCRTDLKQLRKETLFVQLLENIHPNEADLILHVKDQKLTKKYPKITHKLVAEAGFIPHPAAKEAKVKNSKAPEATGAQPTEKEI
jgi:hypothetical protein